MCLGTETDDRVVPPEGEEKKQPDFGIIRPLLSLLSRSSCSPRHLLLFSFNVASVMWLSERATAPGRWSIRTQSESGADRKGRGNSIQKEENC